MTTPSQPYTFTALRQALAATETEAAQREEAWRASDTALRARVAELEAQLAAATVKPAPPTGVRWGTSPERRGGETYSAALTRLRTSLGADNTQALRVFGSAVTWPIATAPAAAQLPPYDGTLIFSTKAPPASILTGAMDAPFRSMFTKARSYLDAHPTVRFYWTNIHEPEDNTEKGLFTAQQWRDAMSRLIDVQHGEFPHERMGSIAILMKYSLEPASKRAPDEFVPAGVDVLGFDTYMWGPKPSSVAAMIDPCAAMAKRLGKRWGVCETGISITVGDRRRILTDLAAYISKQNPTPEFVCYFNSTPPDVSLTHKWAIDSNPAEVTAWKAGQR